MILQRFLVRTVMFVFSLLLVVLKLVVTTLTTTTVEFLLQVLTLMLLQLHQKMTKTLLV